GRSIPAPKWRKGRPDGSDVEVVSELGALLDEAETRIGLVAHQVLDRPAGVGVLDDGDAQERAPGGVHGGFPELRWHHLAKALEAADLDLAPAVELALQQFLAVRVIARISDLGALRQAVERRHGEIEMAAADEFG